MTAYRRYEVLLPRRFNDGTRVPTALLEETSQELEARFGADSAETQTIVGAWRQGRRSHREELTRLFVDVPATAEHEQFFLEFKERLKKRFDQVEVWITSHDIRVL